MILVSHSRPMRAIDTPRFRYAPDATPVYLVRVPAATAAAERFLTLPMRRANTPDVLDNVLVAFAHERDAEPHARDPRGRLTPALVRTDVLGAKDTCARLRMPLAVLLETRDGAPEMAYYRPYEFILVS